MTDGRPLIEVLNFRHWCRSQVRPRWELLSAAPVSFRLACGDALRLEDIQLVGIITTRVHA